MVTLLATVCAHATYTISVPTPEDDGVTVIVTTDDYGQLPNNFSEYPEGAQVLFNDAARTTIKFVGKFSLDDLSRFQNNPLNKYTVVDFSEAEFENKEGQWGGNAQKFYSWRDNITTAILSENKEYNDYIFDSCQKLTTIKYKGMVATVEKGTDNKYTITFTKSGNSDDDTYFNSVLGRFNNGNDLKEIVAKNPTAFNTTTGTLTLADLDSNVSALVISLSDLKTKGDINTIEFPDGSTYDVSSGKYTAASGSANTETYKGWLTANDYTVDASFDKNTGTLTLANQNSSVSTLVSDANLSDLTSKNDIKIIVFDDGSTYNVASGEYTAAYNSTNTTSYTEWLTDNGYTVSSTVEKIGDFATWDEVNGILTLDYTTGNTLSSTGPDGNNSYQNILGNTKYKDNINKVVIKSEDTEGKRFKADDFSSMLDWSSATKIMDLTQAEGIDVYITDKNMKCKAIYLPSNFTFPATTVYANENNTTTAWNQEKKLLYVCQLKENGELYIGGTSHDCTPTDAIKAALNQSPLEYPFSEATHITLQGSSHTTDDATAVNTFNARHALTSFDSGTGTLTLSNLDSNLEGEGGIISSLTNLSQKSDIKVINFPDGSSYNVSTGTLSTTSSSHSDIDSWLSTNGYTVSSTVTTSFTGTYVTVVDGVTTLTIPDNETDVVTGNIDNSSKLSAAEKNALKAATNLVVKGSVTDDDWYGLQQISATTLDLTDAKIGSSCVLASKLRDNVQNLTMPNDASYTSVPADFAYNAIALQSVTLPRQITEIGNNAFFGCTQLASVSLPGNLSTIGESAFSRSGLTALVLPSKLTTVGADAFFDCEQLENVEMKQLSGSCTFGNRAFGSCFQLKHVTLSEGVDAISTQMFDKCSMLESIRIPSTCKTIGQEAFNICASLHSIVIPEGVETIEKQAFTNSGITDIYVMATSEATVPKIYSMGSDWGGNDSTFGSAMVTGNSHDPYETHKDDIGAADDATILSWYQEEFSDGRLGVGGGDCLVRLHYPEEMRYFYDGFNNPLTTDETQPWSKGWDPSVNDALSSSEITAKMNVIAGSTNHYISDGYAAGERAFGEDQNHKYWPSRVDYLLRLQAGNPTLYDDPNNSGNKLTEPSSLGWRQLPLQQASKPDDFVFTKEYDDTWYTMCFPWDMEDNTLFSTFNQKLEIVEFVGVEVKEDNSTNPKSMNLIFHFDEVAGTYYMTENHRDDGLEYERVETHPSIPNTTRVETINIAGYDVKKKYYTYHLKSGSDSGYEYVYWPFNLPKDKSQYTNDQKEMVKRYEAIRHYMVFAGHPYMIHPSIGANPEKGTKKCTIAGVKKLDKGTFGTLKARYADLVDKNKVTKATTTNGTFQNPGTTYYDNQQSHYTFIGNIYDTDDQDNTTTNRSYMTDADHPHAYFLAVDPNAGGNLKYYPKYFRKSKDNEKVASWSQYSAIIRPDAAAIADIEAYMNLSNNGGSSSAKSFDIEFGKWEVVDVTAIEEIISEAERKNQTVEKVHLNVVFNIKGQVIREGSDSVDGLPKGLYIVNGKKYMVK